MTNELEKKFFDTFNLTKYKLVSKYNKLLTYGPYDTLEDTKTVAKGLMDCFIIEEVYPQISDRILLELIVVIMFHEDLYGYPRNVKDLKENVLKQLMETYNKFSSSSYEYQQTAKDIKHQVRTLFKEG